LIEVKNLTKRYGDITAVDHLSFTVDEGQVYGFLGPNGAGKSTTMNIMTGYIASTEGDVIINGHNILEEPEEAKKTIGYLPEIPPLYTDMTVLEYLKFVAELKKVPKAERKSQIDEVMQKLAIDGVQGRLIRNLSKGYRQRVGFAQALLGNPETLILDEPTVGLDPQQIIEIRELIKSLGKDHTVILSSHILSEVSEICDTVLIISKGKLVALDTPENLGKSTNETSYLVITVQGTEDNVRSALASVPQAHDAEISTDEQGLVHVRIMLPGDEDIRPAVSQALFGRSCMIYEMNLEKASLENIFLELTQQEEAPMPADDSVNEKDYSELMADEVGSTSPEADAEETPADEKASEKTEGDETK